MTFIKENFPILLLSLFILIFTAVTMYVFMRLGGSKDAVSWATNAFSGFMGALLGLITGRAIGHSDALGKLIPPPSGTDASGSPVAPPAGTVGSAGSSVGGI